MTALPGDADGLVTVICDGCGEVREATDMLRDEEVVWPSIHRLGWTGSPFATGTHHCPACADTVRRTTPAPTAGTAPGRACQVRDVAGSRIRVVVLRADLDQQLVDRVRPIVVGTTGAGRDLVVDMRHAPVIDSAGLGLLVRAHRDARRRGARLCLVAPSRFVLTVLHTMHLDGVFTILPDQTAAVSLLTGRAARRTGGGFSGRRRRAEPAPA
ncbi:hypothetical protein Aca07nite_00080 [Actinoplanes capillaceus]|uniref:STAS domain-containing protein n=1 Tax=Actinoplanes campanulatus TaxID=113559 RepID=A0ABQ3WBF5_9ACTN|nr:STAS domain-containing protein [Actinoplanes capillaceus]GID42733.1 hypothetical protein Aca07nite_00080 [Actinoplanes capillaceus]